MSIAETNEQTELSSSKNGIAEFSSPKKPNVLYVVHRVPYPPNRGDRIRSYHVLRYLSSKANVWLATLADEPLHSSCQAELDALCVRNHIETLDVRRWMNGVASVAMGRTITEGLFHSRKLHAVIDEWSNEVKFDAIYGFCSSVAPYILKPQFRKIPKLMDLVDVDSEKFQEYSQKSFGPKRFIFGLEAKRLRKLETQIGEECDSVTLVTAPEAKLYQSFSKNSRVRSVTNGIDLNYYSQQESDESSKNSSPICLFVGALDYPPNVDALRMFCQNVWPKVSQQLPSAEFHIVGRNPTAGVNRLQSIPGVRVFANVPDVRPYYRDAKVAVAPLQIARGLQNKILEAMAMKTPVISSPEAIEGIPFRRHWAAVARTDSEWVAMVYGLLNCNYTHSVITNKGFEFVQQHHRWDRCLDPISRELGIDRTESNDDEQTTDQTETESGDTAFSMETLNLQDLYAKSKRSRSR